ncbi:MAG: ester cyclase [Pseudomonadota bacterium]
MNKQSLTAAILFLAVSGPAQAQSELPDSFVDTVRQVTTHIGEMSVSLDAVETEVEDKLRFEPYQQLEDMFFRDDVVYLMRHGPTDWSKLDEKNVAPTDCANQRLMSEDGKARMRDFGALFASNGIIPSQIVVSQWCRNQQTLEHMFEGFDRVDPEIAANMPVETDGEVNLLLSLQGAKNTTALRDRVAAWEGNPDRKGPLLIISHYTNIEELTQFRVFEGEVLVLDPKRDNQVLGYIRLQSAGPDSGHFADALNSPLLEESEALDMVNRYYAALASQNPDALNEIVSERWVANGIVPTLGVQDAESFLKEVALITEGLTDSHFEVDEVYVADSVVTVVGTITGKHTSEIYGIEATGKDVSFGGIAVHRVADGVIVESWQMADRLTLLQQITN